MAPPRLHVPATLDLHTERALRDELQRRLPNYGHALQPGRVP